MRSGSFRSRWRKAGCALEMAFWRSTSATLLLYGAAVMHFSLALWTLYSRREWRLPWIEILRLASGFSFPLLLIGHAVTTRLGDTLFAIKPSYAMIITNLLMAGRQGMQLALLAPGWLHGCLGLWITLRQFLPCNESSTCWSRWSCWFPCWPRSASSGWRRRFVPWDRLLRPAPMRRLRKSTLAAWKDDLTMAYLGAVLAAFALGRLHALLRRRWSEVQSKFSRAASLARARCRPWRPIRRPRPRPAPASPQSAHAHRGNDRTHQAPCREQVQPALEAASHILDPADRGRRDAAGENPQRVGPGDPAGCRGAGQDHRRQRPEMAVGGHTAR